MVTRLYVNDVNDFDRLRRFLCLGSEVSTCYVSLSGFVSPDLGPENVKCVCRLITAGRGVEIVNELESFSEEGRVVKHDSLLLVLAMCARLGDEKTKLRAYKAVDRLCRIPTHLFQFIELCENVSEGTGWGRAHRRAIEKWYLRFRDDPLKLALLVTKYCKRKNMTHKDVIRLAHVKADSPGVAVVVRYIIKGIDAAVSACSDQIDTPVEIVHTLSFLKAVEEVKRLGNTPDDVQHACEAIRNHNLVREHIPTQMLNSVDVWKALLINMPLNAMIRNLGKMTSMLMLELGSEGADIVIKKLKNDKTLRFARMHPFNLLLSMFIYQQGRGERGNIFWQPNQDITGALDDAFYMSVKHIEPTKKRYCLAVDVSASMSSPMTGSKAITARQAAAAQSMIIARTEHYCEIVGFSETLVPIDINADMQLTQVMEVFSCIPAGATDCASPMLWAMRENKKFDVFIVYTASEPGLGLVPPAHALRDYRRHSGIHDAKLIVCAFESNGFTIADPNDSGMLDMAGFDSNGHTIMNTFITAM